MWIFGRRNVRYRDERCGMERGDNEALENEDWPMRTSGIQTDTVNKTIDSAVFSITTTHTPPSPSL